MKLHEAAKQGAFLLCGMYNTLNLQIDKRMLRNNHAKQNLFTINYNVLSIQEYSWFWSTKF
jgi:hypothetical protein